VSVWNHSGDLSTEDDSSNSQVVAGVAFTKHTVGLHIFESLRPLGKIVEDSTKLTCLEISLPVIGSSTALIGL